VQIDALFLAGNTLNKSPFRLISSEINNSDFIGVQVLISVPKRRFKLAVTRNRIRRIISEAYRLNSLGFQQYVETQRKHVILAFIFTGKKEMHFPVIETKMQEILGALKNNIQN